MNHNIVPMSRKEIICGFIYLGIQLLLAQPILILIDAVFSLSLSAVQLNFIYFAVNFICTTVLFRKFIFVNLKVAVALPFRTLQSAGIGFILYWISSFLLGIIIVWVYPDFYNVNDSSVEGLIQENAALMTVGTVLLVPIAEELLYRGLIFSSLYSRSRILAYIVSGVAFSALHIIGYLGLYAPLHLFLCFLQYLPAGIILAWSYARSGTILSPILIHAAINQIAILSMR